MPPAGREEDHAHKPAVNAKSAPPHKTPAKPPPAPADVDEGIGEIIEEFAEETPADKPLAKVKAPPVSKSPAKKPTVPAEADEEIVEDFDVEPEEEPAAGKTAGKKQAAPAAVEELEEVADGEDDVVEEEEPAKPKKPAKKKGKAAVAPDLPDDFWEQCAMLQHDRLMSKVKYSVFGSKWVISDPDTEEQLGIAVERVSFWKIMLRALKFQSWLSTVIEVRESADGPVLFTVRKLAAIFRLVNTVEIYDFRKEKIGYFKAKLFATVGGFWVYDADGEHVAEVKMKLAGGLSVSIGKASMPAYVTFLLADGRKLGDISSEKGKGLKGLLSTKGKIIDLVPEMRDQVQLKVLLLAATLAMDLGAK